ncbi:MAG: sugar transferase [Candidatus Kapaibacterium sp.]|jgi:lipopolysaccharide/colanic/teichoic acid biosynthesis glycosyltransferase
MHNGTQTYPHTLPVVLAVSPHESYLRLRRVLEILCIILCLPILIPLCLLVALVVLVDSGLPILYFQDRPGKKGKRFRIAKFRTMRHRPEEDNRITTDNDPRVTKYGIFLRQHRLDELPQFWNVLRGEMSIIGPRPEAYYTAEEFCQTVPHYMDRYAIAPGITGWQQVQQGHVNTYEGECIRVEYDRFYIANVSFSMDCKIVLLTISTMIRGAKSR